MSFFRKTQFKDFIRLQRGFDLPKKDRVSGSYPVIASTSINGYHKNYKVKGPGVVTGRSGSLGEVLYVEDNYWPLNTTLWVRNFKGNNPRFVYYFLKTMNLERYNSGVGVPTLNRNHLDTIEISIPNVEYQNIIASILGSFDDLVEVNLRRIGVLEEVARLMYEEWFVHFRFPGHEDAEIIEIPHGPTPKGWKWERLEEVANVNKESISPKKAPKQIHYIDISSVALGKISEISELFFKEAPSRARRIIKNGDVIWSTVRPNRKSFALILDPNKNTIASTGFAVINAKEIPFTYLYCAITTDAFTQYLTNRARGAAYPAVNVEDFNNAMVLVPSTEVLEIFNEHTYSLFKLIHVLDEKNKILIQTRDLLLPKLISGEIDISDLDIQT